MKNLLSKIFLSIAFTFFTIILHAQVGIGTNNPNSSAALDIESTEKGLLMPRMSQNDLLNITNPANGLLVFNITDEKFFVFVASENRWKEIKYGDDTIYVDATYSIGSGGMCSGIQVNGDYIEGFSLLENSSILLDITFTKVGYFSISTNTVNGYGFSGTYLYTGSVPNTVSYQIAASGTPIISQTDIFTATASNGGSCNFSINVSSAPAPCVNPITYGGKNYSITPIGTQCWMTENLDIGIMINANTAQTDNGNIEKYCYDNNASNCTTYGGLYKWDEMMQYTTNESTQGICPTGWHIPSDYEWKILEMRLGMSLQQANSVNSRGTDEGGKLKEIGTTHWANPNTGATNSSNFSALPAGQRTTSFLKITLSSYFWTSTESGLFVAHVRELSNTNSKIRRVYEANNKATHQKSLRCVRD